MALVVIEKAADQEFQMISSLLGFPTFGGPVVYHQGKCKYQALYIARIILVIYISWLGFDWTCCLTLDWSHPA